MDTGFDMLAIPLQTIADGQGGWWVLESVKAKMSLDPLQCAPMQGLPDGWCGRRYAGSGQAPIKVLAEGGEAVLRLFETVGYAWELAVPFEQQSAVRVLSSLLSNQQRQWRQKGERSGEFCVVNYLGGADFRVLWEGLALIRLKLRIESRKLDFATEYRAMTEDIAGFCQQLLLQWQAPTSLGFSADSTKPAKLLLEQFLFLRHFMSSERMGLLLEAIDRNPHVHLRKEREWLPAGCARGTDYLRDPMRALRGWRRTVSGIRASEVLEVRKVETLDTDPNRFVKFALNSFRKLCLDVIALQENRTVEQDDGPHTTLSEEASALLAELDGLLSRRLFKEVGNMQRLPLDNQTLQKREGYREVLHGWLLTRASAALDWEGLQDVFAATTRDVATLYEYWIFLKLHKLLSEMPGMTTQRVTGGNGPSDFLTESNGRLTIALKSGKHAVARFVYLADTDKALQVELHYERSFSYSHEVGAGGSYSRRFRPDYTLTLYPAVFASEADAGSTGKVAHLHFDAKYRAEQVEQLIGKDADDEDELTGEKRESKAESTYRRGDLLKMHTYNDALRHSIGSYVLYPGSDTEKPVRMGKFHEIAPGVGVYVMKPGNDQCIESLQSFLLDIFRHQIDHFTQYRYLADTTWRTVAQPTAYVEEEQQKYAVARRDAPCVVLWIAKDKEALFRQHGLAYCRVDFADETKRKLGLNLSIEVGSEFIPCGGGQGGRKICHGWRAKIRAARFMARDPLRAYLQSKGAWQLSPQSAEHYILFEFTDPRAFKQIDLTELYRSKVSGSDYMAVTCSWGEILDSIRVPSAS